MIPEHLDPALPLSKEQIEVLKPGTIARLRKNGRAHMARARKKNAEFIEINKGIEDPRFHRDLCEIVDFDPIEVYEEHNWTCVSCFRRVDVTKAGNHPDSCVLGHRINLAHSGGHTPENCGPWHYSCNAAIASSVETPREAKAARLRKAQGIIDGDKVPKNKFKKKIPTRRFKAGSSKWPEGRKLRGRGFQKKGARHDEG